MIMWCSPGKSIQELTVDEINNEIRVRANRIASLRRDLQYADYGAYGQDRNEISSLLYEIEQLTYYRNITV